MSTLADVILWGSRIGAVSCADGDAVASFQYDPDFLGSGIQVSPLVMPLGQQVFRFPALSLRSFHGLPGLLSDSLPDKYGNALIDAWLARQGRTSDSFNAVERLCYVGTRGMGALEFRPSTGPSSSPDHALDIAELVSLASDVLTRRDAVRASFAEGTKEEAMREILRVGTSAGGARAKAVVAWNPTTNEVRSGQLLLDSGFEHWLIKFDGVADNRDKEFADPQGYGVVEYVFSQMASVAGISMSPCRLMEEGGRRHFMTRRFDRTGDGDKLHMQSLGALAHFDFNDPASYSYEQAFLVMRQIGLAAPEFEQQFRRVVFNVVARNQDDHVKNIAYLMDRAGDWKLSPAYDMTWAYNPTGDWTAKHQMSVNGKREGFTRDDLMTCGRAANIKPARIRSIIQDVRAAVGQWSKMAAATNVRPEWIPQIRDSFRSEI